MLKRENYLDSFVQQCSPEAEGAVTFLNAAPNGNVISGGVEIQFRGGVFTTNDPDAIKLLDFMAMRGQGIARADEEERPVDPLTPVAKQEAKDIAEKAKAAATAAAAAAQK